MNAEQTGLISKTVRVGSTDYIYQLYIPPQLKSTGNLPLIIFLHALHERGLGGFAKPGGIWDSIITQYFKNVPAIVLLPQCPPEKYWSDSVVDKMVMQSLDKTVSEFSTDPHRIYLIGISMGGYGVWHFAYAHPGKFAALIPICGGSPLQDENRFMPVAAKVGKTPVWVFHGAKDNVVPVSESREIVKALNLNQGNVKYSEYENIGHNVWMQALAEKDLMNWLLSQHK